MTPHNLDDKSAPFFGNALNIDRRIDVSELSDHSGCALTELTSRRGEA